MVCQICLGRWIYLVNVCKHLLYAIVDLRTTPVTRKVLPLLEICKVLGQVDVAGCSEEKQNLIKGEGFLGWAALFCLGFGKISEPHKKKDLHEKKRVSHIDNLERTLIRVQCER